MSKEKIIELIDAFLDPSVQNDYEWKEITSEQMNDFYEIIMAIADAKFGRDCDNISQIAPVLCDKAKHYPLQPFNIYRTNMAQFYSGKNLQQKWH